MKVEIVNITPITARALLQANTNNRTLRKNHVERLRASFERGEYRMTHQGIAFDDSGVLCDGQHRLTAIAQCPEHMVFPMLVSHGLKRAEVFPVIDIVSAPRSVSDVLSVDRKVAEVGQFLCRMFVGRSTNVTPTQARPFIELTHEAAAELVAFCGSASKTWSAAPVRAAAAVSIIRGHGDYAKKMYRALVLADFESMTPVVTGLFRSHLNGRVRATDAADLFVRCGRAFNPANAGLTKIQVNDLSGDLAEFRLWLDAAIGKKEAPAEAGAKTGSRRDLSLAA